jgi:hypothetical protein
MKKFLAILVASLALTVSAAETKKVCVDKLTKDGKVLVGKDGKPQQECREIKIHKKLEGTKVPEKK